MLATLFAAFILLNSAQTLNAAQCPSERNDLASIKSEVAAFEGAQPNAAIEYLTTHKTRVFPTGVSIDTASCKNVPCAVNRIYGFEDDARTGWVIYWFYLKTGYVIATADRLPGYKSPEDATYKDFLFKPEEIEAFWKLAWMWGKTLSRISTVKSFHRAPPKAVLRNGVCGQFRSKDEAIDLADHCLYLLKEWKEKLPNGKIRTTRVSADIYFNITHEIAHALAWQKKSDFYDSNDFSTENSNWLTLSDWDLNSEHQWISKSNVNFVSDYAKQSPAEDWADTLAAMRTEPDTAQTKVPEKTKFISNEVFNGRLFTTAGLVEYYANKIEQDAVVAKENLDATIQQTITDLRSNEWEACKILDLYEKPLIDRAKSKLKTSLNNDSAPAL